MKVFGGNKKLLVTGAVVSAAFLASTLGGSVMAYASSEREVGIIAVPAAVSAEKQGVSPRVNKTIIVDNVPTDRLLEVYSTNNILNETLKVYPISLGPGITSLDIFVTWGGGLGTESGSVEYDFVQAENIRTVKIPWNAGNYHIYIKAHGESGHSVTMWISDVGN
ncbi:MAG: hypothetical protein LBU36_07325 [Clostridiales bacterium]|jgi:hypothetical protein|nr:hypothetical protein [Clostridiales bacterium]